MVQASGRWGIVFFFLVSVFDHVINGKGKISTFWAVRVAAYYWGKVRGGNDATQHGRSSGSLPVGNGIGLHVKTEGKGEDRV